MSIKPVKLVKVMNGETKELAKKCSNFSQRIRERAYELYEKRGKAGGHALEDWMAAERELDAIHTCGCSDLDRRIDVRATLGGVDASDLRVAVGPQFITVEGNTAPSSSSKKRPFIHRFVLPAPVDPSSARASMQDGVLAIGVDELRPA